MTLEQMRTKNAWQAADKCSEKFMTLAKGAPALVMSNGLMPSLAFWKSKAKDNNEHDKLVNCITSWLKERKLIQDHEFSKAMDSLQVASSTKFMQATNETLEYLKWLRNFASAIYKKDKGN